MEKLILQLMEENSTLKEENVSLRKEITELKTYKNKLFSLEEMKVINSLLNLLEEHGIEYVEELEEILVANKRERLKFSEIKLK